MKNIYAGKHIPNYKKINDCLKEIRQSDENTQINSSFIKYLCKKNLINSHRFNKLIHIDYDNLIEYLSMGNKDYNELNIVPRIRTITKAAEFYKENGFTFVTYSLIKSFCNLNKMPYIEIGTRKYVNLDILEKLMQSKENEL